MRQLSRIAWLSAVLSALAGTNARAQVLADSKAEFSGTQGQADWFYGYRNYTADGGGENYDPSAGFIAFAGGEGQGAWDGVGQLWTGSVWDLETAAAGPWTTIEAESVHPNGDNSAPNEEHWVVRRWVANELTGTTWTKIVWNTRKQNTGGGNGVTGGVWVEGKRVSSAAIAGNNGTGVTISNFVSLAKGARVDLVLTPAGPDGGRADGADGSLHWMTVEVAADTDGDGLPDEWETRYATNLTTLSGGGDADKDGLTDVQELNRGSDPTKADSDGDGLLDGVETNTGKYVSATDTGTDPMKADTDGDRRKDGDEINGTPKTDPFDPDSDDDTYSDGLETANGHNPNDANDTLLSNLLANSIADFSGAQGRGDWSNGYRNATADGGAQDYDPAKAFIQFPGGENDGDWNGTTQVWNGSQWDLNTAAAAPWTELGPENVHPNGPNPVHWVIRRWEAKSLTKVTPLALRYTVRKTNLGCGNGVTGALYINGKRVDAVTVPAADGVGAIRTYFANVAPGDKVDVILSPRGTDGSNADGCDGSAFALFIDPALPVAPVQPSGELFIPAGAPDTDSDGMPDAWEAFLVGNITRLSASGDFDSDGLKDPDEYKRDSDPRAADTDADGLSDAVETKTGVWASKTDTGTDPKKADSDADGLSDSAEVNGAPATDPNKADSDGDKFSDSEEIAEGTNPNDAKDNPRTYVIADSVSEFSGVQGKDGWYNGYRNFTADGGGAYDAKTQFIPYPGGEGQGEWDGVGQMWTGTAWDLNTQAAGPWTWQMSESIHPNGSNSAPNEEHWAIRRWVADELTKDTQATIIWQVRKDNAAGGGVGARLFVNGTEVDAQVLAGNSTNNPKRRYATTLRKGDVVDLAVTPENADGSRGDGSDGSVSWFWIDTRPPAADDKLTVSRSDTGLQVTFPAGASLESAPAIVGPWSAVAGATSPYSVTPSDGARFYRTRR